MQTADPRRPAAAVDSGWQGLCGNYVCYHGWRDVDAAHAVAVRVETVQTDNVPAYAEVYVDDVLRGEGEVGVKRDFLAPVGNPGRHRVEVVLANPVTRNAEGRRVRISSLTTL